MSESVENTSPRPRSARTGRTRELQRANRERDESNQAQRAVICMTCGSPRNSGNANTVVRRQRNLFPQIRRSIASFPALEGHRRLIVINHLSRSVPSACIHSCRIKRSQAVRGIEEADRIQGADLHMKQQPTLQTLREALAKRQQAKGFLARRSPDKPRSWHNCEAGCRDRNGDGRVQNSRRSVD